MTEVLVTHIQPVGDRKPGSAGVLLANVESKVINTNMFAICEN